ncbi:MAG: glycosyltransferase family 2 protein [Candidatus Brocadia sp.]|nr:glycosyltransferase family 2 protein [Candidatus Brocadia sp.]
MKVSVIIPAYNAAGTIADTLQSLLDQTFTEWEAIIVDDGSTDDTSVIVNKFIEKDSRFRIIKQTNQGLSGARNSGITHARYNWLLFLDADDWIFPQHLNRLTSALKVDPGLKVVYCGWTYVTPDGEHVFPRFANLEGDLFVAFAQYCVSVVHTFIISRSLVELHGCFENSHRSCEDWDLFQRIARTGIRFGAVNEILAGYRMRPDSLSRNGHQLLVDGIKVLNRGHGPDLRVPYSHPVYPNGLPRDKLTKNKYDLLYACAGYLIGGEKDARSLLEMLKDERCPDLNANEVASCLFTHTIVSAARPRSEWYRVWSRCEYQLKTFLEALEMQTGTAGLTRRATLYVKHLILKHATDPSLYRRFDYFKDGLFFGMLKLLHKSHRTIRQLVHFCRKHYV